LPRTVSPSPPGSLAGAVTARKQVSDRVAKFSRAAKGLGGVFVCVAAWETVRGLGFVDPRDLPSFVAILRATFHAIFEDELLASLMATLSSWALGLTLALFIGVVAGALLATMPRLERTTDLSSNSCARFRLLRSFPSPC